MKTTRIARKLGLDGNPLRRRTDKIAARLAALLLAVFVIGAPSLSVAAASWAGHHGAAGLRAGRSWHKVSAVLLQGAPAPSATGGVLRSYPVLARWTVPNGRPRTGRIPVSAGLRAGRTVRLWVDPAGSPTGPPPNHRLMVANEATAAVTATVTLGIVLLCLAWAGRWVLDRRRLAAWEEAWVCLAWAGRWVLDRRRLAAWEEAWAAVGPHWTKRFRSRG